MILGRVMCAPRLLYIIMCYECVAIRTTERYDLSLSTEDSCRHVVEKESEQIALIFYNKTLHLFLTVLDRASDYESFLVPCKKAI